MTYAEHLSDPNEGPDGYSREIIEELMEVLRPFIDFGQALKALETIGDVDKLEADSSVISLSGGGGTWRLSWSDFEEALDLWKELH